LVENKRLDDAKEMINNIEFINTTLLLSQGKSWIENGNEKKLIEVFSCKNSNDIIGEFLFLISNLYSSQDNFKKSNFYLNLSNFSNPKFVFNLSLVAENHYLNLEYKKAKKILKNFKKEDSFYFWYRVKKEAQIIAKQRNNQEALNYITAEFSKINQPNKKILFDIANFYKNSKEYKKAISYYSKIIDDLSDMSEIKSDLLYRRGGSYERLGNYDQADKDLLNALKINPDDAYVLNYLAYSWLERDYKIKEAIEMLETAYELKNNDPYIIDSIGWAYYLIDDYTKAEKFLKRAVELMPGDPTVNDHYGDILWKLNRKIQARYFWTSVLNLKDTEDKMKKNINIKLIEGLKSS
jgi:tetratricopeptide (TPR) repeat protein